MIRFIRSLRKQRSEIRKSEERDTKLTASNKSDVVIYLPLKK